MSRCDDKVGDFSFASRKNSVFAVESYKKTFIKDLKKLNDKTIYKRVINAIEQVKKENALSDIASMKKLKGDNKSYRIRVGTYRIGLEEKDDTIFFVRFLHRKDIYRNFP